MAAKKSAEKLRAETVVKQLTEKLTWVSRATELNPCEPSGYQSWREPRVTARTSRGYVIVTIRPRLFSEYVINLSLDQAEHYLNALMRGCVSLPDESNCVPDYTLDTLSQARWQKYVAAFDAEAAKALRRAELARQRYAEVERANEG